MIKNQFAVYKKREFESGHYMKKRVSPHMEFYERMKEAAWEDPNMKGSMLINCQKAIERYGNQVNQFESNPVNSAVQSISRVTALRYEEVLTACPVKPAFASGLSIKAMMLLDYHPTTDKFMFLDSLSHNPDVLKHGVSDLDACRNYINIYNNSDIKNIPAKAGLARSVYEHCMPEKLKLRI